MKLKFIKKIDILGSAFNVIWDKTSNGGSFSWGESRITVGCKDYKKDPTYTFNVLSHEIMEALLVGLGARYGNGREALFLFSFNHQTFETAVELHAQALSKFLI